ncbi:cycloheximide resistance protein [Colletotrichum tofieldiae]|nr:cycloheximide resistance protein [Colletotrichum tofieldiae]
MSRDDTNAAESSAVERRPDCEKIDMEGEGLRDPNIVDFDGPNDPEHPLNWSTTRKTTSIVIVSLTALLSPIGSTISAAAAADIMQHFGTTNETLGALMTTIYLLGYAFGPVIIAPLSELYGRAIVFQSCTLMFTIFNIACAVANSFGSLVVYRLLAGIAGSCAGTSGAGSIADMIVREKRGAVMSAYIMGPTLGPTIGPIIGGNLTATAGWRWGFWLMAIASGVMAVFIIFFLHESYPYVILKRKTARLRQNTGNQNLRSALDANASKTPASCLLFVGTVSDPWFAHLTKKNGVAKPEYRLPTFIVGAVFVPIGLFWYGWSAEYKAHWIVPIIGTAFTGIGIVTAYTTTSTYLIDAYTVYSASVMAASAILRCVFGALLPLAGSAMFDALGVGWGNSVLGFISLAFLPLPLILFFYGERIRKSRLWKMEL